MTVARVPRGENAGTALRWGACLALVLGLHASLALVLLRRAPRPEPPLLAPDAVMLELAPAPAAPAEVSPPQPAAPPLPAPKPDLEPPPVEPPSPAESLLLPEPAPQAVPPAVPSLPHPAVALPEPPFPPLPVPKRPPPRPAARSQPPRPAQASPPQQASEAPTASAVPVPAPAPAATQPPSSAAPGWRNELAGRLQRAKHYPDVARAREEQGTATVRFTIDRSGHVLSASLVRGSGSQSLDEEAVALVRRADPLPPVPAELAGSTLTLTVPVVFVVP